MPASVQLLIIPFIKPKTFLILTISHTVSRTQDTKTKVRRESSHKSSQFYMEKGEVRALPEVC